MHRVVGLLAIVALLTLAAWVSSLAVSAQTAGSDAVRVQVVERGVRRLRTVPREDYVAATALSEFAPSAGDSAIVEAMFEVQAIIARTYAASHRGRHAAQGFDLCATTHCQLYEPGRLATSRWAGAVRVAVARTAGVVLLSGAAPAEALYHADCGGQTSAAEDVWGRTGYTYLRSRLDDGPAQGAHVEWHYAVDAEALRRALNADPRTAVGRRLRSLRVGGRDGAGRAQGVILSGDREVTVRGTDLREVVARRFGARSIRSTLFEVARVGNRFEFVGRGFGHGVGLCQAGALARLAAGADAREVLRYYYPGLTLEPVVAGSYGWPGLMPSSRTPPG